LLIFTFFVDLAKGADPVLAIKLTDSTPVQYCNTPVPLAESLTVEGNFILPGMKISINEGYYAGEDTLLYSGSIGNIVSTWDDRIGCLHLKGDANTTIDNYRDAIKSVRYKNNKLIPTLGTRKITITLEDADYFIGTEHFYRFVSKSGIKWTEAEAEAKSDAMKYYGLRGYLATITSMYENSFIQSKTKGVGWIGASDEAVEGDWRWVTGPEGLNGGLLFWKGTGNQAKMNNPSGVYGPVNGAYHNWNRWDMGFSSANPCIYEPNNSGNGTCGPNIAPGEDYAHITYFPNNSNDSYKWNDLPNTGGSGDYASAGYLIEFGDMPGDPEVHLSATLLLQVNTMFFTNKGIQAAICEGDSIILNKADTTHAVYRWTPVDGSLSSLTIASPTAKPKVPTTYFVMGTRGVCTDTASYKVKVNPKPIVSLGRDTTICNPGNIVLTAGNQFTSYQWLPNGETKASITATKNGEYSVKVTDAFGCNASSGINVSFTDKPKIDFSRLDTLVCGKKTDVLDITADKGSFTVERLSDDFMFNNLSIAVPGFGSYDLKIKATDQFTCHSDSVVKVGFYKIPTVSFDFDSTTCKGYNLPARYKGDADTIVSNFKWVFGGEIIADTIGRNFLVVPLGINRAKRDLQLTVTQDGCTNSFTQPDIKVIPNLDLQIIDSLGCEPFNAEFKAVNTEVVKYFWDFGDNSPVIEGAPNTSHIYQKTAYYDVKLKVTTIVTIGEGCTNEVKIDSMVHVAPKPVVAFSLSPTDCLEPGENQISFTGSGLNGTDQDTYTWYLDDFNASEKLNDPQGTPGPFKFDLKTKPMATVGLTVKSEYGCESLPGSILVKRKPDFLIQSDLLAGCVPFNPTLLGVVNVMDIVDKVDFSWNITDGSTGSGSPYSPTFNDPDKTYSVTLKGISSETQCLNEVIQPDFLRTYPKPTAAFSMDNKIVYNDKPDVKFTDLSLGASAWLWNFGEGSTSTLQNLTYHFMKMGPHQVTLEVSNAEGCTDEIIDTVLVAFDRLFPPNGFSPNASNEIDRVFLLNSDGIAPEGYHFTVLSRWNDVVFEAKDVIKGWDGRTESGSFAPAGAYIWILNFSDFLGRKHQQTGTVTLVY